MLERYTVNVDGNPKTEISSGEYQSVKRWVKVGNENPVMVSIIMGLLAITASIILTSVQLDYSNVQIITSKELSNLDRKTTSLKEIIRADSDFRQIALNVKAHRTAFTLLALSCSEKNRSCSRENFNELFAEREALVKAISNAEVHLESILRSSQHLWNYNLLELSNEVGSFVREEKHLLLQVKLRMAAEPDQKYFTEIASDNELDGFDVSSFSEGYFGESIEPQKALADEISTID